MTLLQNGFILEKVIEPQPPEELLEVPGMKDEMRRPMMLLIAARKADLKIVKQLICEDQLFCVIVRNNWRSL